MRPHIWPHPHDRWVHLWPHLEKILSVPSVSDGSARTLFLGIEGECGVTTRVTLEFSDVSTRRSHVFFGVHSGQNSPLVRHTRGAHQNVCNFHELVRQGRMCRTQLNARTFSLFADAEGRVRAYAKQKKLHTASAVSEAVRRRNRSKHTHFL